MSKGYLEVSLPEPYLGGNISAEVYEVKGAKVELPILQFYEADGKIYYGGNGRHEHEAEAELAR